MADIYSLSIRADTRDVTRAKQALDGLANGSVKAQRATQQLTNVSVRSGRQFRVNTQLINQAGFQVGDFATQVASGGNALVAFTQQFGQLAGFIGPAGPVLGAIVAIGGAISIGLVNAFGEAEESTEELTEKMRDLVQQLGRASDRQREIINTGFASTIAEQTAKIEEQREVIFENNREMETFVRRLSEQEAEALRANGSLDKWTDAVEKARNQIALSEGVIEATRKQQTEFWKELDKGSDSAEKQAEQLENLVTGIQAQADTIGLSARQTALYEAARLGANEADIQAINNAFDLIEAERQRMNLQKAMQASGTVKPKDDPLLQRIEAERRGQEILLQQQQDYTEARERLDSNMLSSATSTASALAGAIGDMAGKQSAAYQAAFVAQQAFAIASAIVNTQMAAAAALAPPPIGLGPVAGAPYAAVVEGLGAANVAIIAAQTLTGLAEAQSGARMHGGSVSSGGRYLVGEDGPEIVTMGGSGVVTPSSVMGTGEPSMPNITVNMIEDNARSGQVEQRRQDDGSVEINAFVSDITSGGRRAKAMESVYGLRRQGR